MAVEAEMEEPFQPKCWSASLVIGAKEKICKENVELCRALLMDENEDSSMTCCFCFLFLFF